MDIRTYPTYSPIEDMYEIYCANGETYVISVVWILSHIWISVAYARYVVRDERTNDMPWKIQCLAWCWRAAERTVVRLTIIIIIIVVTVSENEFRVLWISWFRNCQSPRLGWHTHTPHTSVVWKKLRQTHILFSPNWKWSNVCGA